jgi:hypothetical protein
MTETLLESLAQTALIFLHVIVVTGCFAATIGLMKFIQWLRDR